MFAVYQYGSCIPYQMQDVGYQPDTKMLAEYKNISQATDCYQDTKIYLDAKMLAAYHTVRWMLDA